MLPESLTKYAVKFSSHERYVPQGVYPFAQFWNVPFTIVPVGSCAVLINGCPAAGPLIRNGVSAVILRPYLESRTVRQRVPSHRISNTPSPCAFFDFCTFSAFHVAMPSVESRLSSVYS